MSDITLWGDIFEPEEILEPLGKAMPLVVASINSMGYADYMWLDSQGNRRQVERKQIAEALSDLDSVEEQLNRELETCDELTLLVENPWLPTPDGVQTFKYQLMKDGRAAFFPNHRFTKQPYLVSKWEGLKEGLRKAGIDVIEVPDMIVTSQTIAAMYKSSWKEESTTLRRYVRPHIPPFSPNIHVENLMRLKGANIGPVRAKKAIDQYKTFHRVVTADVRRLSSLWGSAVAKQFMQLLGRDPNE
jgi:ERCC4-type nuclease